MIKLQNQEIEVLRFLKEVKQGIQSVKLNDRFFNGDHKNLGCFERLNELELINFIDGNYDISPVFDISTPYQTGTFWAKILPKGEEALANYLKCKTSK